MTIRGRRFFFILWFGSLGGWLFLLALASRYEDGANYSLIEEQLYMGGRVRQPPPGTGAVLNLDEAEDDVSLHQPCLGTHPRQCAGSGHRLAPPHGPVY